MSYATARYLFTFVCESISMGANMLVEAVLELLAPTHCAGCERPGSVLCDVCIEDISVYRDRHLCPRCGAPYGELVCTECQGREFSFDYAICLGELDGPLARAVVIFKDGPEIRLGPVLGDLLAQRCVGHLLGAEAPVDLVTWIPPTARALKRRGFDHAGIVADRVARRLGVECTQFLARQHMRDLRNLSRDERMVEVVGTYRWVDEDVHIAGRRILIVDDVLTTASTLEGASRMFKDLGALSVVGAVLARAW